MPSERGEKLHMVMMMIYEVVEGYKNQISGKFDPKRRRDGQAQQQQMTGGIRIKQQMWKLYKEYDNFTATSEYSDMAIERAIAMHEGDSIPGFPSVDLLIYLLQPQLEKIREPAIELIQDIYMQLEQLAGGIVERVFRRCPSIRGEVMDIICEVLQE